MGLTRPWHEYHLMNSSRIAQLTRRKFLRNSLNLKKEKMETTIRVNTDLLTPDFIEGVKKLFPHKMVEIVIQLADETEYLLSNPSLAKELQDRIATYESKKEVISLKLDELI